MTIPHRLENGIDNRPDADEVMNNYDWLTSIQEGNFLLNGGFEETSNFWSNAVAGTTPPTYTLAVDTDSPHLGASSAHLELTGAGSSDYFISMYQLVAEVGRLQGNNAVFGMWVKASTGSKVRLRVYDGVTEAFSSYHSGGGTYELLTVNIAVSATAKYLRVEPISKGDFTGDVYWDDGFVYFTPASMLQDAKEALAWETIFTRAPLHDHKNLIINGGMNVWQRGVSFAAIASGDYMADMWRYAKVTTGAVHTVTQSTDVPTVAELGHKASYSLKLDCTTADAAVAAADLLFVRHRVEGFNIRGIVGRTVTLSFWVKSTKTGTFCVNINNTADRSYVMEYTVNVASTWEKKSLTFRLSDQGGTWDYVNGVGLDILWILMAGTDNHTTPNVWGSSLIRATSNQVNAVDSTNNDWFIYGAQLELGPTATELEQVPMPELMELCQRYYEKSYNATVDPATITNVGAQSNYLTGLPSATYAAGQIVQFKTRKRTTPTMVIYSPATGATGKVRDTVAGADVNSGTDYIGESGCQVFSTANGAATSVSLQFHYSANSSL